MCGIVGIITRNLPGIRETLNKLLRARIAASRARSLLDYPFDMSRRPLRGSLHSGLLVILVQRFLRQLKIIQEVLEKTRIQLVVDALFEAKSTVLIIFGIKQWVGDKVTTIEIEQVTEINNEASGKFRYVMSKVAGTNIGANS